MTASSNRSRLRIRMTKTTHSAAMARARTGNIFALWHMKVRGMATVATVTATAAAMTAIAVGSAYAAQGREYGTPPPPPPGPTDDMPARQAPEHKHQNSNPNPNPPAAEETWTCKHTSLNATTSKLTFQGSRRGGLTNKDVLDLWGQGSVSSFSSFFSAKLAMAGGRTFYWESHKIVASTLGAMYECVVIRDNALNKPADPTPFDEHFRNASDDVVAFDNKSVPVTRLVSVKPQHGTPNAAFAYIGTFVHDAPSHLIPALWQRVSQEAHNVLNNHAKVFISTHGGSVPWLHVRVGHEPKYYQYTPYT